MVEVETTKRFKDLEKEGENKWREVGEKFEVSKERFDYLNGGNENGYVVVEFVREIEPEIVLGTTPKSNDNKNEGKVK